MPVFQNRIGILITLIILIFSPLSIAENLTLATGEWIPFTSSSLENYGKFTKRVSIVLKDMGIEANYRFYPWKRSFEMVKNDRIWAAFPYSYTKERAKTVWFSDIISCSKTVFFYYEQEDTPAKYQFKNLEDLKAYKLGGVSGYFYEKSFQNAGLEVDYFYKELNVLQKLKMGRIDLMPLNELVGQNLINTHFPGEANKFKTLDKPLSVDSLRLIVSKKYPETKKLLDRFNQALKRCIKNELIKVEECN